MQTARRARVDRLSELVTHLSGVPLEQAERAIEAASNRPGDADDNLLSVAAAMVRLRTDW